MELANMTRQFGTLPRAGGFLDQDQLHIRMIAAVYSAWEELARMEASD